MIEPKRDSKVQNPPDDVERQVERGYNCNLELVGQFRRGAFSQDGPAFLDNCAYYANGEQGWAETLRCCGVGCLGSPPSTADRYLDDTPQDATRTKR